MCTRFFIEQNEPAFQSIFQKAEKTALYDTFRNRLGHMVKTEGEIFPTDVVPVIASNRSGNPSAFPMCWGIRMADGTPLFNARSETAGVKPFFKEDWERRRCIVPASYYFEWKRGSKTASGSAIAGQNSLFQPASSSETLAPGKYAIQPDGASVTWLCGIYRIEDGLPYFAILTRDPSDEMRRIHDRMPVILPQGKINEWINPATDPFSLLSYTLTDMVFDRAE